ncbi:hypothetical protein GCM10022243_67050 [Saccharothrix violaceirubra]|uniref:Uncharacterized protein n=1 Tax=Saccharothrix violaceirubra TaxID=413306 RepID=A0A7W7WWE5_9PSEU|nr:hypothetical protein [Saccharothrix violaceirubra]MBB4965508.1 hypothetical protein [Saccharothrix violaceirubra]
MTTATASLRTEGPEDDLGALVKWLRDEDGLRGRVSLAASSPGQGEMGAALDAVVVVLTGGTASVLVRSLFDYLKHRRTTSKVTLRVRGEHGRELDSFSPQSPCLDRTVSWSGGFASDSPETRLDGHVSRFLTLHCVVDHTGGRCCV